MMGFECLQELNEHLLLGSLTLNDVRVLVSSVRILDVVNVEEA